MSKIRSPVIIVGTLAVLAVAVLAIVILLVAREPHVPAAVPLGNATGSAHATARPSLAYDPVPLGRPAQGRPVITHVDTTDLDDDGLLDVLVCDAQADTVSWIRQSPRGVFTEMTLGEKVLGPAHVAVCDLNLDGRRDLLVASMGIVMPNNDRIGSVIVLENLGGGQFRNRVLAENIARVTDVQGADFNGDGRVDLVVGQFGYIEGEIRWMENLGDWKFTSHQALAAAGTIHTPVADFDADGRMDFAALVSQDAEEVRVFKNTGAGSFRDGLVWKSSNPSWNSSGLSLCDLNRDGRPDLLYTNGDGFNESFMAPAPWHGLQWLENRGGVFNYHRIGDQAGCYGPVGVDLDGDGDTDIVTVSAFNDLNDAGAVWMTAWINDGAQHFTPVPLAHEPTHLITVAAGDLDGNGIPVLVTGGFHAFPPFPSVSRVTLWRRTPPSDTIR